MRLARTSLLIVSWLLSVAGAVSPLAAQEHHWQKVAVSARLEADGSMSVQERQYMVFSGPLNGGERIFRLLMRQRLDFRGISRLDANGNATKLVEGDLSAVDQFQWKDSKTLRWRSRLPSDPDFDRTLLIYQLDYRISNVVVPKGDHYALDHEFLFTDRSGVVEQFSLDFDVDPAWRVEGEWRRHASAGPLPPGEGYQVELELEWTGSGAAAPVVPVARPFLPLQLLILAAIAAGMIYLVRDFKQRQGALGRLDPLPVLPAGQEGPWLEENLLKFQPEVVGALWDRSVGPPEVAALMARWISEGKMRSRVEQKTLFLGMGKTEVLHLELLADRDSFATYERSLVERFFFGYRTQVDTDSLREHYKSRGFDPAGIIRKELEASLERQPEWREKAANKPEKKPTVVLLLAGLATILLDLLVDLDTGFFSLAFFGFPLIGVYLIPLFMGIFCRSRVEKVGRSLFWFSLPPRFYWLYLLLMTLVSPLPFDPTYAWSPGHFALLGFGLVLLGLYRSVLNIASSRETREGIATRRWLAAARNYFGGELQKPQPAFSDRMFPYLLAFGLDRNVDRWFRSFGGRDLDPVMRQSHPYGSASSGSSGSSSSPLGGGFSGGGGLFGGAGASASWAAAASSFSSGVAAPSSSSSGGGGSSSSSSSSGGGGGGAW